MMQEHPYDTFFDESMLSKADPDLRGSIKELLDSKRILQKCIDIKKPR